MARKASAIGHRRRLAVGESPELLERRLMPGLRASRDCRVALSDLVHEPGHRAVGRRQVRRDRLEMEIGAVVEDRAADRDADRAAEVAHHVEQAARIFEPFRRQAAEAEIDARRHRKHLGKAAQDLRQEEFRRAPFMGDEAETPHRQAEGREADHHEPARVESFREHDIDRHADERRHPGRENGHAGLPGAKSAHVAEKQRREIDGREDADAGDEREDAAER